VTGNNNSVVTFVKDPPKVIDKPTVVKEVKSIDGRLKIKEIKLPKQNTEPESVQELKEKIEILKK
jgi:hypothetical protein